MEYVANRDSGLNRLLGVPALLLIIAAVVWLSSQATPASRTAARPVPTQQVKRIAVVNDDPDRLDTISEYVSSFLTGSLPVPFLNCEALLAAMEAGERFTVYVMDYDMPGMDGVSCTRAVLNLHPGAIVIGNSMSDGVERQFLDNGAKFFNKGGASSTLIDILKNLGF